MTNKSNLGPFEGLPEPFASDFWSSWIARDYEGLTDDMLGYIKSLQQEVQTLKEEYEDMCRYSSVRDYD